MARITFGIVFLYDAAEPINQEIQWQTLHPLRPK